MNQTQLNKDKLIKHFIPFNQGLFNLNNTCYMNSILTCVTQLDEFLLKFGSKNISPFLASLDNKSLFKSLHHLIIGHYQNKDYLDFLQEVFVENIHEKNIFLRGQQNDANEFLVFLINWLAEEITQLMTTCLADIVMTGHLDACLQFLKEDFKVKLNCIIDCKRNGCRTTTNEEEILILNVQNNQTGVSFKNINSCINEYFKSVSLTCICPFKIHNNANNRCQAFYCATCQDYVDASMTKRIVSLPKYLAVNLVIFDLHEVRKIIKYVHTFKNPVSLKAHKVSSSA